MRYKPPTMNVDIGKKVGIMTLAFFCEVLFNKSIMEGLSCTKNVYSEINWKSWIMSVPCSATNWMQFLFKHISGKKDPWKLGTYKILIRNILLGTNSLCHKPYKFLQKSLAGSVWCARSRLVDGSQPLYLFPFCSNRVILTTVLVHSRKCSCGIQH